jgi:apolipoprotein N-acyltransferase
MFIKIAGLLTIIVHPLFFIPFLILLFYLYRSFGVITALIAFPFIWTGFEYFHNLGELAFPWIELGNSETYNLNRIQYAELFGVHGITFYICIITSLFYYIIIVRPLKSIMPKTALFILFVLPYIYSILFTDDSPDKYINNTDKLKTNIIQTNIDPWKKWSDPVSVIVDKQISQISSAPIDSTDLVVLHETALPYYFHSPYFVNETNKYISYSNNNKMNLLVGTPHMHYYNNDAEAPLSSKTANDGRKYDTYNSAVLIEPGKESNDFKIYTKSRLVPFSERTPYQELMPFLTKFVKWSVGLSAWQIGNGQQIFIMKNRKGDKEYRFGTVICFESAFSDYVSEFSKLGSQFLVIITNDGWFGNSSGPVQHKQFSVLRAIENRKWIIRAAQTGISCYVDPFGNIYNETEFNTEAVLSGNIYANNVLTFYSRNGDLIGKASMYLSILAFLVIVVYQVNMKKVKRKA